MPDERLGVDAALVRHSAVNHAPDREDAERREAARVAREREAVQRPGSCPAVAPIERPRLLARLVEEDELVRVVLGHVRLEDRALQNVAPRRNDADLLAGDPAPQQRAADRPNAVRRAELVPQLLHHLIQVQRAVPLLEKGDEPIDAIAGNEAGASTPAAGRRLVVTVPPKPCDDPPDRGEGYARNSELRELLAA